MSDAHALDKGYSALAAGRRAEARTEFERCLAREESAGALYGLGMALWWQGQTHRAVELAGRAESLFRRVGDLTGAVRAAIWLAITYKADFGNVAAANGWLARADRLLAPLEGGLLHGWAWVGRAYRMTDLAAAEELTARALSLARSVDPDLELVALSQLGLIRVQKGAAAEGLRLIDEAMAGALAGEGVTLDTVVYTCCDMLTACDLVADLERAEQWCAVADGFVGSYGCPFLYAECRIHYGSVLAAQGRWGDAERELTIGLRSAQGTSPGVHDRAALRLASLRARQGRLEEAAELLAAADLVDDLERTVARAGLALANGDAPGARRVLQERLSDGAGDRWHVMVALDLLVDAHLAEGEVDAAVSDTTRMRSLLEGSSAHRLRATAAGALGRVAMVTGPPNAAVEHLQAAVQHWIEAGLPYELARARLDLARAVASRQPERAADEASRSLVAFERMGAGHEVDRAAVLLRGLGVTLRTGVRGPGPLTARERQVLQLLGRGLSNPEIGRSLHITPKTASHHVSSILSKLGLRNRAEAAAHAATVLAEPPRRSDSAGGRSARPRGPT